MRRIVLYIIVLLLSAQCFAQDETQNSVQSKKVVTIPDTVISGIKFRRYNFEFESVEFSKEIFFTLPLTGDDTVLQAICNDLLGGEYDSKMLEDELLEEINMYMDRVASNPELIDAEKMDERYSETEYYESSWHITPIFVGGGHIAFVSYFSEYFGGAIHHMWGRVSNVYSLSTGKLITQDDIFDDSGAHRYLVASKLFSLLNKYLGEDNDIEDANVMGMLNDNFYFTDKELIYMYVPYEVAYYAAGEPELALPKKWLKPYLNVDGPLYKYWFGKKK
ncbi:MAG: DUF3298 domain-containing protein [Bacteroidales bacterium]|nr:DUF3298 domain-containing protein [Bacteroidales bacterium]